MRIGPNRETLADRRGRAGSTGTGGDRHVSIRKPRGDAGHAGRKPEAMPRAVARSGDLATAQRPHDSAGGAPSVTRRRAQPKPIPVRPAQTAPLGSAAAAPGASSMILLATPPGTVLG